MNDRSTDRSSLFSSMLFFLAGGVAGAGVALLLAPQSGTATRDMMRRRLSEGAGSAGDLKDRLIRRGQKLRDEARRRTSGAVSALAGDGGAKLPG
jgi:gas vesicle protein